MPAPQESREVSVLCHEHHVRMIFTHTVLGGEGKGALSVEYECSEPECPVHYNGHRGYFILSHDGSTTDPDSLPKVKCANDGTPMYLAEIDPEKTSFRLWKCPQCGGGHTNKEGLIGEA